MPRGEVNAQIGAANRAAVLDYYMIHEADLDGVVTISSLDVGRAVGISQSAASYHLRALVSDGALTAVGHTDGVQGHSVLIFHVAEEVLA